MKLTRIISLLLVFVMLMLTFASCNLFGPATEESTSETTPGTEDSTSSTSKNPDENPEPEKDDWDDIKKGISANILNMTSKTITLKRSKDSSLQLSVKNLSDGSLLIVYKSID